MRTGLPTAVPLPSSAFAIQTKIHYFDQTETHVAGVAVARVVHVVGDVVVAVAFAHLACGKKMIASALLLVVPVPLAE